MEGISNLTNNQELSQIHDVDIAEPERGGIQQDTVLSQSLQVPLCTSTPMVSADVLPGNPEQYANNLKLVGVKRKMIGTKGGYNLLKRVRSMDRSQSESQNDLMETGERTTDGVSQNSRVSRLIGSKVGNVPSGNSSLLSEGKKKVILIKPDEINGKNVVNNPIEIVKILKESAFQNLTIDDVRVNKRKGLTIIEVERYATCDLQKVLSITKLGQWPVRCYVPNNEMYKCGVISPVELEVDLESVKEAIDSRYRVAAVTRLNKKKPNGEWVPSPTLKIVFEEDELPRDIRVGYSFYKVRPYVNEPLRCYKCQRLGHTAQGCNARVRCLRCGGDHLMDQCKSDVEKCANCSGSHRANSRCCSIYRTACDIEKVKAFRQINHDEARKYVISRSNLAQNGAPTRRINTDESGNAILMKEVRRSIDQPSSYRDVAMTPITQLQSVSTDVYEQKSTCNVRRYTSASTQTEKGDCLNDQGTDEEFLSKLKAFLLELFQGKFLQESEKAKDLLIESAMRNNFGIRPHIPHNRGNHSSKQKSLGNNEECMEEDSLEDEVLSVNGSLTDNDEIWQTVEKKQVKVTTGKVDENQKRSKHKNSVRKSNRKKYK